MKNLTFILDAYTMHVVHSFILYTDNICQLLLILSLLGLTLFCPTLKNTHHQLNAFLGLVIFDTLIKIYVGRLITHVRVSDSDFRNQYYMIIYKDY